MYTRQKVIAELDKEDVLYRRDTEIVIIIETPASVLVAEDLAKEVDIFSVGTVDIRKSIAKICTLEKLVYLTRA